MSCICLLKRIFFDLTTVWWCIWFGTSIWIYDYEMKIKMKMKMKIKMKMIMKMKMKMMSMKMTITLHALTLLAITMITAGKQLQIGQRWRSSPSTHTNRTITFGSKILFLWRLARCCHCYHTLLVIVHESSRNFFSSKIHYITCLRLQVRKDEVVGRRSRGRFYLTLRHYHQCRRTNGGSGNWVQSPK